MLSDSELVGPRTSLAGSVEVNGATLPLDPEPIKVMAADEVDLDTVVVSEDTTPKDTYMTEDGITFKLQKVGNLIIHQASLKLIEPRVPILWMPDKERSEENPNDPDYKDALQKWGVERGLLLINTYLAFGTMLAPDCELPLNKLRVEDKEWSDDLKETLDIDIPIKGRARYLAWLKFHVLSDTDLNGLAGAVMAFSGRVTQGDVEAAAATFQGDEAGGTNLVVPTGEEVRLANSNRNDVRGDS